MRSRERSEADSTVRKLLTAKRLEFGPRNVWRSQTLQRTVCTKKTRNNQCNDAILNFRRQAQSHRAQKKPRDTDKKPTQRNCHNSLGRGNDDIFIDALNGVNDKPDRSAPVAHRRCNLFTAQSTQQLMVNPEIATETCSSDLTPYPHSKAIRS